MTKHLNLLLAVLMCAPVACQPVKSTAIQDSVRAEDAAKIQQLLAETPALVNHKDRLGDTPLDVALGHGETATAEMLRRHGGIQAPK